MAKSRNRRKDYLKRSSADRHRLYEWAVQEIDFEIDFIERVYRRQHGRYPRLLREDFCGSALLACSWAARHPERRAIGIDLDVETLAWAEHHNRAPLGAAAERVTLLQQDVRSVTRPAADVACAYNFSYCGLFPLDVLEDYFRSVKRSLRPGGLFFLDCYGGWQSQQVLVERRRVDTPRGRFDFIWEQAQFNPIDNRVQCYIHFEFGKGKRWRKVFAYDWRLYAPAEISDALARAGFARSWVYWDHSPDPEENDFHPAELAENSPGWLAYLVARA